MDENLKANISNVGVWERGAYLVIFLVIFHLVEVAMGALIAFQFLVVLLTGKKHERILVFGRVLTAYVSQVLLYLTQNSDERPFPFGELPEDPGAGGSKSVSVRT